MRILLVEDNDVQARLIRRCLEQADAEQGSAIRRVPDGESAIATLHEVRPLPDLVLLDVELPAMNGLGVLDHIRGCCATRLIPVIVLSGVSARRMITRAYEHGATAFIVKPENLDLLRSHMRSLLAFWGDTTALPDTQSPNGSF